MDFDSEPNHGVLPLKAETSAPGVMDDRSLNFSTSPEEFDLAFMKKPKTIRDPMSHRIIEKRRRDRMNNCLADLSRLIPTNYLKQGQGRIEKTEIIEMAIKHITNLTNMISKHGGLKSSLPDRYLGFKECQDEVMRYLVEVEGWDAMDKLCNRLMAHLEQQGEKFRIMNDESLDQITKEEQYRHADEELGVPSMKPSVMESGGSPQQDFNSDAASTQPQYAKMQRLPHGLPSSNSSVSESLGMETQDSLSGYETFPNAQQMTQEHLKRDRHLWTLLTTKYNSRTTEDSGVSTGSSSALNMVDANKYVNKHHGNDNNPGREAMPDFTNTTCSDLMETESGKNSSSVYKFKHNITKRFSQEEKKVIRSDTSSSSSMEDKRIEKLKRKYRHIRAHSPSSSGSSRYPKSDSSNKKGSSASESGSGSNNLKMSNLLPGFVLHPTGTHYIPLSIHPSNMSSAFFTKSIHEELKVYHPISIPVDFKGPLLYMKKVSVILNKEPAESSASSPSCRSGEMSSRCSSENSPTPEQRVFKSQTQ